MHEHAQTIDAHLRRASACARLVQRSALLMLVLMGCDAFDASLLAPRDQLGATRATDADTSDANADASSELARDEREDETMRDDAAREASDASADSGLDASDPVDEPRCDDDDAGERCSDACPDDPAKSEPGLCGCGHPDSDEGEVVSCAGLRDALAHRYSFESTGNTVFDSRSGKDGTAMGVSLTGTGTLALAGGQSEQYVELPNGLISRHKDLTIEVWMSWRGDSDWERIFDFGNNDGAEGDQGMATSSLMLSPRVIGTDTLRVAFTSSASASVIHVDAPLALPTSEMHHVAVVFDDTNDALRLYLDGVLQGSVLMTDSLSSIEDTNNWLGRSQFAADDELGGELDELRIYDSALSDAQVALSFASGQAPQFLAD